MDKRRGGCAPNIAYTLALLGERPYLMATAGQDFGEYGSGSRLPAWTRRCSAGARQVHRVLLLQHGQRKQPDRVVLHRGDGARRRAVVPNGQGRRLVIVSPNDPAAMIQYAEECRTLGMPYIFDPGQQCARMSGAELRDGIVGATL